VTVASLVAVVVVGLCLAGLVAPAVAPGQAAVEQRYPPSPPTDCRAGAPAPTRATVSQPTVNGTIRRVGDDGDRIEVSYDGPADVDLLVFAGSDVDVVASEGFTADAVDDGFGSLDRFEWNGSADRHSIRYRPDRKYPSGDGWALAPVPMHRRADVALEPAGEGYVGPDVVTLGPHDTDSVTVGCQTITAIVPDAVDGVNVSARLSDVGYAAGALDVGQAPETVRIHLTPRTVGSEIGGFTLGNSSTSVVQATTERYPDSVVWMHEYVHTRQRTGLEAESAWLTEATATYLSVRLATEGGRLTPREHDRLLAQSELRADTTTPLTSVGPHAPLTYDRGAVVLSRLERTTWTANRTTVGDLLAVLNAEPSPDRTTVDRFMRTRGGLSPESVERFDTAVTTTRDVRPAYLLDPAWLPPTARILVPMAGSGPARLGMGFVVVIVLSRGVLARAR
jgi:hypothetical protein